MKKKNVKFMVVTALMFGLLSACGDKESQTSDTTQVSTAAVETTITVNDSDGAIEVPKNPKKVVVFDNGSLDTLNRLGVSDVVIGAPTSNLPAYLEDYTDVESAGGIKEPDIEKINQLQPDLIIISGRQQDFKDKLSAIAPTLYMSVDTADTWNSTKENIETLAKIFDKTTEAEKQIKALQTEIDTLKEKAEASEKKALIVMVNEGQLSAYGNGSRFGIIHDTFAFSEADESIETSTHGQSVSYEYILEKNPDILFVIDRTKAVGGEDDAGSVADNALVKQTNAGKNNQVIALQSDIWYLSGGGLESTQLMIDDVTKALD